MSEPVGGSVAAGFEAVREAFSRNFAEGRETGAAFAAWRGDEKLVDLWGGLADRPGGRPWAEDSLQLVFSGSKGITAICMMLLLDRGLLDLDEPVHRYWPAFGKPEILVRHVLSHSARLPGIEEPTSWADLLDDRLMARRLERQQPFADPRAAFTYHPLTYGWLCGELLRQIDGRSIGHFLAEEIAGPFGLEIWFGLPAEHEHRVTTVEADDVWGRASKNTIVPTDAQRDADPLQSAIWYNPPLFGPDCSHWNARSLHAAQMPGAGAIGTARSIARLYALLAAGGAPLLRPGTLERARRPLAEGLDVLNGDPRRFAAGFSLQTSARQYGPPDDGFGHGGAGGSVHGAWPTEAVGFSYAMNRLIDRDDPRAARLLVALHDAVRAGA